MAYPFTKVEAGTTSKFTWSADTSPASLFLAIKTASATLVASIAAVSSGVGAWYAYVTVPDSFGKYPAYLLQEWTATISTQAGSASPFITRAVFEIGRASCRERV